MMSLLQPAGTSRSSTSERISMRRQRAAPFSVTFTFARILPRSGCDIDQGFRATGVPLEVSKPFFAHFYIIQKPK